MIIHKSPTKSHLFLTLDARFYKGPILFYV